MGYRGEEHGEDVDGGLGDVAAEDGHHDGGQEGQVAEREQQRRRQLPTEGLGRGGVRAPPAPPPCRQNGPRDAKSGSQRGQRG